jgi:DNA polymerase-3 subunit delta'
MAWHDILGQDNALRLLRNALERSRLAHAYLLAGPPGVGKHLTARQFAKAVSCPVQTIDACGTCATCKKIDADNHPDILDIEPDGNTIRIEHIRTIQHRLSYKPYEQGRIVIILDGCEWLTPPATNALLKTLEEPPGHALLLLLTSHKTALPLTITSRCQLVPFRSLTPDHLRTILERRGDEREAATLSVMMSQGGLTTSEQVTAALEARSQAHVLLADVLQNNAQAVFLRARQLAGKRDQCEALLDWLILLCRDLVMLHVAPSRPLYNDDLRPDLEPLARQVRVDPLLETCTVAEQLRQYLGMNLNPQLVFERFVMRFEQLVGQPQGEPLRAPPAVS